MSNIFTYVAGQEAPASISRGRNACFSGVFFPFYVVFAKTYVIIFMVKKVGIVYETNNYGKTSDFS